MDMEVIQTVSGQYKIVDAGDNEYGSPLVTFHNQTSREDVAIEVMRLIANLFREQD